MKTILVKVPTYNFLLFFRLLPFKSLRGIFYNPPQVIIQVKDKDYEYLLKLLDIFYMDLLIDGFEPLDAEGFLNISK